MSSELNTGADWEQSKRLVIHWHNRWAKLNNDHLAIVAELEARINRLRLALQKIADEDFRGNRPSGSVKAYQALKDDEAMGG